MNFLNVLGILAAGGIGVAAGGMLDLPFKSKTPKQENNLQPEIIVPQIQEKVEPVLTFSNSLEQDQVDVLKTIWRNGDSTNKHLIDYFDYQGWVNKAKEYSLLRDKWPGDIIFIEDKSNEHLGEKLRDKCYSAAQWFFIITRSDNNEDVKNFMKNVYGNFSWKETINLCATDKSTLPENIKIVRKKTLSSAGAEAYACKSEDTIKEQWIKEVYGVKKDHYSSGDTMCQIIKETPVIEIEYINGTKKYQFLKSRKNSSDSGYESIPGDGKIYSSILKIPGISDLFEPKK